MRLLVVDDQINSRANAADWICNTFAQGEAISQDEPLTSIDALLQRIERDRIDTVVLDYKMARTYAPANGMILAIQLFDAKIPSVILSTYVEQGLPDYFWLGAKVPALLSRSELHSGLAEAVERAHRRIRGDHTRETLPSRTVIRIDSIDDDDVGLLIPGYRSDGKLVKHRDLQARFPGVDLKVGLRFMGEVNLGARNLDQLYVTNLEPAPELDEEHARLLRR
ncbi:MAG: hypothetical protein LW860_09430 [Xanthomonadaceae bacterium]|nr:hypothetical protein [Xanthomonadaceae bacterium]